jgi:AbrB family looped-hinge helix DNA binding protein
MPISTLTTKGQITIPKEIREFLKLRTGQRVEFYVDRHGQVILRPRLHDVRMLKGMLRSPHRRPVSVEEMNEAIAHGASET